MGSSTFGLAEHLVPALRLEETAIIFRGRFADGPFTFDGDHFPVRAVDGSPTPVQQPGPPIMIGGGGRTVLAVAARQADVVQLMPSNPDGRSSLDASQLSEAAIEEEVGWIRDAAGARFDDIDLSAQLLACAVTDQPDERLSDFVERVAIVTVQMGGARVDELHRSPIVAVGPLDEVCEKLVAVRDTYAISYFVAPIDARPEILAPVIEALADA